MNLYFVYILKCSDGLTYTGITDNITRRLTEHQNGTNKTAFTYQRRQVKLIFQQEFNDVLQAIYFEKRIKKWSAKKKFALAAGDMDLLQILSECRNASHYKFNPKQD
jgi:putative endonuclease